MKLINALLVYPNTVPIKLQIKNNIESIQKIIKGPLKKISLSDDVVIICDIESQYNKVLPNRIFNNVIIYDKFLVIVNKENTYKSLSDVQINKYKEFFNDKNIAIMQKKINAKKLVEKLRTRRFI